MNDIVYQFMLNLRKLENEFEFKHNAKPKYVKIPSYIVDILSYYDLTVCYKHGKYIYIDGLKICAVNYECDVEVF